MLPDPLLRTHQSQNATSDLPLPPTVRALGLPGAGGGGAPELLLEAAQVAVEERERLLVQEERLSEARLEGEPDQPLERARRAALWGSFCDLSLQLGEECGVELSRKRRHALLTAECAQMLAVRSGRAERLPAPERSWGLGLLHDVGQLELLARQGSRYGLLLRDTRGPVRPITEDELELFGVDHASLGADLCRNWGFTEAESLAVACHHGPQEALAQEPSCALLFLADAIARAAGLGRAGGARELCPTAEVLLGVSMFAYAEVISEAGELWRRLPG